ncbi:Reverse transcriptase RNA-dependent DNA polymerase [Trinorchestia longiramus]|nr:Reverse transcriptase RNA-dependent DNA polymerase [Trinorchestia longiramus]
MWYLMNFSLSFEKEPSKEIECVPCSFSQVEKHEDSEGELELRRLTRNRAAPDRFGEWVCFAQDKFDVPANVEEALHGLESKLWKAPMEEEMASMNINNVWSLVECPKNKKPIRCEWIFKKKTGPDGNVCSYKVRFVAQGLQLLKNHWTCVKRIFRYLKGTSELGILYSNCSDKCVGYSNADWAGGRSDRKSTSGYCFTLSNSLITWRSVKQSCVALSTAEAEYVALDGAAQEAIWLKHLLDDLEFKTGGPMVVNEDNQSAICLTQNPKYHGRSKHIDIKFHYFRDLVRNKEIDLVYCLSNDMLVDIFTKGLSTEKFSRLRRKLGVDFFEKHIQCEKEC